MNRMVSRRNQLVAFMAEYLSDGFSIADRLRRETFDSQTRAERQKVMGNPTRYCEVLYAGDGSERQQSAIGQTILDSDLFRVNVWLEYKDCDNYEHSSQKEFDDLCFDEQRGIVTVLNDTDMLDNVYPGAVFGITGLETLVVSMDESGQELAHFLTFNITIR